MNRSMLICVTLPLAAALTGCPSTPPGGGEEENDSTGITTFGTSGDGDGDSGDGDAGDGDGDPGDGDSGDGDDDGPDCGEVSIIPEYVPPNVMLVVDASGSMVSPANNWDHDLDEMTPDVTRWFSLHGVVDSVMSNFGPAMYAGIQRFPSADACDPHPCYDITSCTVSGTPEVGVALDNAAEVLAAIPGPDATSEDIEGGTPATKGINSAINHLLDSNPNLERYILLVTDGAANCNTDLPFPDYIESYDETLPTTVEAAFMNDNITTFVVGIDIIDELVGAGADGAPEANPFERLNDVALAGGAPKNGGMDTEKFFNATNQDELLAALEEILGNVTSCEIDLTMTEEGPPAPEQIPFVEFTSDGETVPKIDNCDTEDGWTWVEEGLIVTFCGTYCTDFKNGAATFDGKYGCPPPG
ncbi:von Willebrand factor type A domain protein [Enhygromyxa salina]|uniref:von Willebrand factor type A domain protein n=1 Tax=Enhygromyxa salina TaxID=215803 RepID=A0A2S9XHM1_9BACT|nr:vWA domain-containing protein [Enhygromyxa salina]PRP92362.1 von Willebrand factor type A domain protein [Enhygromyxa salina]